MSEEKAITNRIEKTKQFLHNKLFESSYFMEHPAEGEYRYEHSIRTANIGKLIAEGEGLKLENMILGCLLHDVSYCEIFNEGDEWANHGRISAKIARPFLLELGLPKEEVEEICYGIAIHVDDQADFEGPRTALAMSISDADNIDRFDAYRIFEGLKYNKFDSMNLDEKHIFVQNHLQKLLRYREIPVATETGRKLWLEKLDFQTVFYKKLLSQIENSYI
jgi:uncharacterized protein